MKRDSDDENPLAVKEKKEKKPKKEKKDKGKLAIQFA
jgi:hypothetical protein